MLVSRSTEMGHAIRRKNARIEAVRLTEVVLLGILYYNIYHISKILFVLSLLNGR